MLKQIVSYVDFNDEEQQETLYFNIAKTELADNLDLEQRFKNIERTFQGPERALLVEEVKEILDLVKTFMRLSYGQRSEDGKRFRKSPEMWQEFTETAAYDAFLYSLFVDPQKAIAFLLGVLPQDLRAEAEAEARTKQPDLFLVKNEPVSNEAADQSEQETVDTRPAWIREDREPTNIELRNMSKEDLMAVYARKNQQ